MGTARTSQTDPLRIDVVAAGRAPGAIGLTICPGKHDRHAISGWWARDLEADLLTIRDWGATALVTLIEPHEFELLKVPDLGDRARGVGLEWAGGRFDPEAWDRERVNRMLGAVRIRRG